MTRGGKQSSGACYEGGGANSTEPKAHESAAAVLNAGCECGSLGLTWPEQSLCPSHSLKCCLCSGLNLAMPREATCVLGQEWGLSFAAVRVNSAVLLLSVAHHLGVTGKWNAACGNKQDFDL